MTHRVISVSAEASVIDAIRLMQKNHINGLPVIDDKGELVDIVSEGDFLRRPETGAERTRSRRLYVFFVQAGLRKSYVPMD